jgi:two-component system cell cycle response regulator
VVFAGQTYRFGSDPGLIIDFLISTFEDAVDKNQQLLEANKALKSALDAITIMETRYRTLIETSADAMLVVAADGMILYANRAASRLFGRNPEELSGAVFEFPLATQAPQEISVELGEDRTMVAELRVVETQWSGEPAFLATLKDVTINVTLREQLRDLSITDELTGLYNRRGFLARAQERMKQRPEGPEDVALLFVDLDDMKRINDTLGHKTGDAALRETTDVLRTCLRHTDVIGRLGGDEFAALLTGVTPGALDRILFRLGEETETLNGGSQRAYQLHLSVGLASRNGDGTHSLDELIALADQRMYENKQAKRDRAGS